MKNILLIFLVCAIFVAHAFFISAEISDLSAGLGFGNNTITTSNPDGISYEKTNSGAMIIFKGGDVSVNGNDFNNIQSQDAAKHPSFLELDRSGSVTDADFTVNEKGGKYVFGNTEITAPPNSRVILDKTAGILIKPADGGKLQEYPKSKNSS